MWRTRTTALAAGSSRKTAAEAVVLRARELGLRAIWTAPALACGAGLPVSREATLAAPFDTVERVLLEGPWRARRLRAGWLARDHRARAAVSKNAGRRACGKPAFWLRERYLRSTMGARVWRWITRRRASLRARFAAPGVSVIAPETNIVAIRLERADGPSAAQVVQRARALGVLLNATGPHALRAVTHLDVTLEQVKHAGERLCEALSG